MLDHSPLSRVYGTQAEIEQYQFVVRAGVGLIASPAANVARVMGIAMESRTVTSGVTKDVTVALPGELYSVKTSEAVLAGDGLKTDANGHAMRANATGDNVVAIALEDAELGAIVPCRTAVSGHTAA